MDSPHKLAIVVPAYKADFLQTALESLAAQSNKNFDVLVADDCSPNGLEIIARGFQTDLSIRYHRFENNLGGASLAGQWARSIRLTNAPWVWLFSDDDLVDRECADVVLNALDGPLSASTRLFHFNTRIIDEDGKVIRDTPQYPERLSPRDFIQARMDRRLSSFACEYVFSRAAFEAVDGFVDFPAAWCSDDASWVALAGDSEIVTLGPAKVNWRRSSRNISSPGSGLGSKKIEAMISYLEWLVKRSVRLERNSAAAWFMCLVREQGLVVGSSQWRRAAAAMHRLDDSSRMARLLELMAGDTLEAARRVKSWARRAD